MIFNTRVNGIPCQCRVINYSPGKPMRITGSGFGDCDPPEEPEFDFEILDRYGYRAEWLDQYVTDKVTANLFEEYAVMLAAERYDC